MVKVQKEVRSMNEEIPHGQLVSNSEAAEAEDDGRYDLSGKPFFDVVLSKSSVMPPYQLYIPSNMVPLLPHAAVPVVLRHGGKNWNTSYNGDARHPRFVNKWKTFVTENNLKHGDACVFELMERSSTNLKFKVHILRNDLPPELMTVMDSRGNTPETPIAID